MRKMVFSLDPDAIGRLRVEPRSRTFPHSAAFPPVLFKLLFELSASCVRGILSACKLLLKLGWNAQP